MTSWDRGDSGLPLVYPKKAFVGNGPIAQDDGVGKCSGMPAIGTKAPEGKTPP